MPNFSLSPKVKINYDDLVQTLRGDFEQIPDHRAANVVHQLPDVLMSAYAIFALKYPSLLCFEQQPGVEQDNLKALFGIKKICSDAQMRRVLDQLEPSHLDQLFSKRIAKLKQSGIQKQYRFLKKYYLCSVDGVRYFESRKVKCQRCQMVQHKNGENSYHHAMLGAVLVHPNRREVFPLMSEAIRRQDGRNKNDSELGASKRLQDKLLGHYPDLPLVIIEDALYANEPHLQQLLDQGRQFITGVKPNKHAALFKQLEGRQKRGQAKELSIKQGTTIHYFRWTNNVPLNGKGNIRVNFLHYEEHQKNKVKRFSWVTSLRLRSGNVEEIMHGARARWKIENETFNTLKNQGYHFEHNYGHGQNHLCDVFAKIMLLAFLIDQMVQAGNQVFNDIWIAAKAKKRLWERLRAVYITRGVKSFKELFLMLAQLYEVQLE